MCTQTGPNCTFILGYSRLLFPSEEEKKNIKPDCSLVESLCNTRHKPAPTSAQNIQDAISFFLFLFPHVRYRTGVPPENSTYILGVTLVHRGQWRSGRHLVCFAGRSAMQRAGQSRAEQTRRRSVKGKGERCLFASLHPL